MMDSQHVSANLLLACSIYVVGTASPGPSNLMVMATAMQAGRRAALAMALGVVSGSLFWGLLAAFGLSGVLAAYSGVLIIVKLLGGLYLLWLALKSARAALADRASAAIVGAPALVSWGRAYLRGAAMHLTNPKAILVWLSIVSLAWPAAARTGDVLCMVFGCATLGLLVFCGYAMAFSTATAVRYYRSLHRYFDGLLAVLFGYAGIRQLA